MTATTQASGQVERCGPALIVLRGRSYVADQASYDGRAVTFRGRLKLGNHTDACRQPRELTIPIGEVERIEWRKAA